MQTTIEGAKLTAHMPVDCKGLLHVIVMVRNSTVERELIAHVQTVAAKQRSEG